MYILCGSRILFMFMETERYCRLMAFPQRWTNTNLILFTSKPINVDHELVSLTVYSVSIVSGKVYCYIYVTIDKNIYQST